MITVARGVKETQGLREQGGKILSGVMITVVRGVKES